MRILKHHLTRRLVNALKFRDELALSRRQLFKLGVITGGGGFGCCHGPLAGI
jgi:hypothetical protein